MKTPASITFDSVNVAIIIKNKTRRILNANMKATAVKAERVRKNTVNSSSCLSRDNPARNKPIKERITPNPA